ncbi:unnamed protein product [Psylliodes chrysocephalus]|uniref:Trehalose 6-phosphate phosphatase n=1 Tax=Psylliodes chrysocephalus TaxID=3402493 RepID=A0A9P0G3K2_9CUCU|nr:unnamed protein product [Psylliodes chrysocephala]
MCSNQNIVFDDYEDYLVNYLQGKPKLAVLLDYDGTLTPIVQHPDLAVIPPETKEVLEKLVKIPEIFVAIISGRNVLNVKTMVGIQNITFAGNHGLEVIYPDGSTYKHTLPKNFEEQVRVLVKQLEKTVVRDGAWIENKGASLTFHFRECPEEQRSQIETEAQKIIEEANFKVGKAHMALEARPKVDWNKGKVAILLLEKEYGSSWQNESKVIFVGDDTTDEDAISALKGNAASFRITKSCTVETQAEKLISSPEETLKILKLVEKIYRK